MNFDNQTVYVNGTALFRCRVQSLSNVNVFWGKSFSPEMKFTDGNCDDYKTWMENRDVSASAF